MDPNTTLHQIDASLRGELPVDTKRDEVNEGCDDLRAWIRRGGCEPNWSAYPLATTYYQMRAEQVKRGRQNTTAVEERIGASSQPDCLSHGAPSPEALKEHAGQLYAALISLLADHETSGVIGSETYLQARRAIFAVHRMTVKDKAST